MTTPNQNTFSTAFDKIEKDKRLRPSHISLYAVLFNFWNKNNFLNPIKVSRKEIMPLTRIKSKATYHKCMRELHDFGYIKYIPNYSPFNATEIYINHTEQKVTPKTKEIRIRILIESD